MQIADSFDPYHKWLAIPPAEQPPTMYRLLGVDRGETDPDVIEAAADRQTAFLRTKQAGPHAAEAAELLNAVASARVCLSNPRFRANYDAVLNSAAPMNPAPEVEANSPPADDDSDSSLKTTGVFGNFEIIELIRGSQFGHYFKARDQQSGRLLTLKVLLGKAAENPEIVKRFKREQNVTMNIDHPNLVKGYAAGSHHDQPYLATEYIVGTDLQTLIGQQGSLPVAQAQDYVVQAARGLTQLHMQGVYHRNLKPQNLLVDMQGRIKVTNLFMARLQNPLGGGDDEELTRMGQSMGTAEYMAPEQAVDAKSVDGRADIYALGCVLHFLLVGRPPYGGKSLMDKITAHRTQPIPRLRDKRSDVPASLDAVFRRMLAKEATGRFEFVGQVADALQQPPKRTLWQRIRRLFGRR